MASETRDLRGQPSQSPSGDRLDSWKEIAAYLKCSERTVRRWEEEGLPVYRHTHKKRAAIYAYKAELDAWWNEGRVRLEEPEEGQGAPRRRLAVWVGVMGLVVLVAGIGAYLVRGRLGRRAPSAPIHSVAVLPLQNLSHDPEEEYFADGMRAICGIGFGLPLYCITELREITRRACLCALR